MMLVVVGLSTKYVGGRTWRHIRVQQTWNSLNTDIKLISQIFFTKTLADDVGSRRPQH